MAEEIKNTASQGAAVSCDAISKEAQAAMIMKERVANNAWHKFCRNKAAVVGIGTAGDYNINMIRIRKRNFFSGFLDQAFISGIHFCTTEQRKTKGEK